MNPPPADSVASGLLWSVLRTWGTRVFSMAVFLILARLLAPAEFGLVNYVLGWMAILLVAADLGLAEYLVYHRDASVDHQQSIWWFQVTLAVILSTAAVVVVIWGGFADKVAGAAAIVPALAASLPVLAAQMVPDALMRRDMRFKQIALRMMVAMLLAGIVSVAAAFAGMGIWSLVIKQWVEAAVGLGILLATGGWRPRWPRAPRLVSVALKGSWGIIGGRLLDVLAQRFDTLIIGSWLGMTSLGHYSVGQRVFQMLQEGLGGAVLNVMSPKFASLQGDLLALKRVFLSAVGAAGLVIGPIMLLGAAFAPEMIVFVLGERWAAGGEVLRWLCVAGLVNALTHLNLGTYLVLALRLQAKYMAINAVNFISMSGLLLLLTPFGLTAAALAAALRYIFVVPLSLMFAWRALGCQLGEHARALAPAYLVTLTMATAVMGGKFLLPRSSWIDLLLLPLVAIAVGILVALLFCRPQVTGYLAALSRRKSASA